MLWRRGTSEVSTSWCRWQGTVGDSSVFRYGRGDPKLLVFPIMNKGVLASSGSWKCIKDQCICLFEGHWLTSLLLFKTLHPRKTEHSEMNLAWFIKFIHVRCMCIFRVEIQAMRKGKIWGWSGQTPWEAFKDYCGKPNAKIVGSHSRREYHRGNVAPPTARHASSKLRVEILQGPAKGESKDVLKSSVKLK